jgi:AcrR family transcriptional regulator
MPRPSQERKMLDAALHCFAELGYEATRIKQIAERAGVSEGALYRHYPSKEAVAHALFDEHMGIYAARLRSVAELDQPVEQRLRGLIRASFESYRANPDGMNFILLQKPRLIAGWLPNPAFPLDIIEGIIRQGQQQGLLRDGQPNLLAAIFLGCLLRPVIVSQLAEPGALDLLHDTRHDSIVEDAAWAAVARPTAK